MLIEYDGVTAERELRVPGYKWVIFNEEQMGLPKVCLEDLKTGTVVSTSLANRNTRVAAYRAWEGARHSRAAGPSWVIAHEMGMKGVNPDEKVEELFHGYGHKSPGDMAREMVHFDNIPLHLALVLFHAGYTNSGQEKSTRYQSSFGNRVLHPVGHYLPRDFPEGELLEIEQRYQPLGNLALQNFAEFRALLARSYARFFKPEDGIKDQVNALSARVLDSARYFLLLGQTTGIAYETSARDWARIISQLKASEVFYHQTVGSQLHKLLCPTPDVEEALGFKAEAPGLVRHAVPDYTTNTNLDELLFFINGETDLLSSVRINRGFPVGTMPGVELILSDRFSMSDKMVAQYLLTLWPGLDREGLLEWIKNADFATKDGISSAIFRKHDHRFEMPPLSKTGETTFVINGSLGDIRDWNRHRAFARFMPLPLMHGPTWSLEIVDQILARGFQLPAYLTHIDKLSSERGRFVANLERYYDQVFEFKRFLGGRFGADIPYNLFVNLLPLAHQMDLWVHGDIGQYNYATWQRFQPGGHINYRIQARAMNRLLAESDPYLSAMDIGKEADPADREQFFDRS